MRKSFTLLFALALGMLTSSAVAQGYYQPGSRTTTLEAGKKYFISVATWYGSGCTNLLFNKDGKLTQSKLMPNAIVTDASYLFEVAKVGENGVYYIKNSEGKYLQSGDLGSTETETGIIAVPYNSVKGTMTCGNDVDACDDSGKRIAYADITDATPLICVYEVNAENKPKGWRYINGLQIGMPTPFAFYEVIEIDNTVIEEQKSELSATIQSVQSLLNTVGFEVTGGEPITLQTTDPTGAGYISCSNIDPEEGNDMKYLIDGDKSTYIHTNWHTVSTDKDYLDVYLGEGKGMSLFQFSEVTRSGASNDFPASIEILGSTDGKQFTTVTTVSGMPTTAGVSYTSPVIECNPTYTYLRFIVTGSIYAANRPYFHMAEFSIFSPLVINTAAEHKNKEKLYYGLHQAVKKAEAAVAGTDIVAITAAKENIDNLLAETNKQYPFVLTTDDTKPALYAIRSGRGDAYWYTYDAADGKIALSQYTAAQTQFWYFKEVATDDYTCALQLYPYLGEGKAMSYQDTKDGAAKIVAQSLDAEGWTNLWLLTATNDEAPYGLQTYNKANYLSNNGGAANKMGMYNAAPSADAGTAMYFATPAGVVEELIKKAEGITQGTAESVGYCTAACIAKINAAIATTRENMENNDFTADVLNAALADLETIQPEEGKLYHIVSACTKGNDSRGGQAMYLNADSCLQFCTSHTDSTNTVFQFVAAGEGKYYLLNVANNTYLSTAKAHGEGQAEVKATSTEAAKAVVITNMGFGNIVKIVPEGGAMLHAQASGSKVVAWDNEGYNEASAWIIVEKKETTDPTPGEGEGEGEGEEPTDPTPGEGEGEGEGEEPTDPTPGEGEGEGEGEEPTDPTPGEGEGEGEGEEPTDPTPGEGEGEDDEDNGIDSAEIDMETAVIYDLLGRRVLKMEKGIYIVNGVKVFVK